MLYSPRGGVNSGGTATLSQRTGIRLFRRDLGPEVELTTVMWIDSLNAVRTFAGQDYEAVVVPPKARAILSRFDERSQHYEVRERLTS
jgi:hypothetical protein